MNRDTSGSAFPLALGWIETDQSNGNQKVVDVRDVEHGLSIRDYFAAKAMHGTMAAMDSSERNYTPPETIAESAYRLADAMLAARVKP